MSRGDIISDFLVTPILLLLFPSIIFFSRALLLRLTISCLAACNASFHANVIGKLLPERRKDDENTSGRCVLVKTQLSRLCTPWNRERGHILRAQATVVAKAWAQRMRCRKVDQNSCEEVAIRNTYNLYVHHTHIRSALEIWENERKDVDRTGG